MLHTTNEERNNQFMKKIFIGIFSALFIVLTNNVRFSSTHQNIDITENHFIDLDKDGNPIVFEIDEEFNKKEYQESLEEHHFPSNNI